MVKDLKREELHKQEEEDPQLIEYSYRWVVVALMGFAFIVNGLAFNTVIPIATKISQTYNISELYVNLPVIISFLGFSIFNLPSNNIIDSKGLKFSFLLGSILYTIGFFFYIFINKSYLFCVFGSILTSLAQPFIRNCPSKVATYWFVEKNRLLATSIMTSFYIIGSGIGFVIPTIVVKEKSFGDDAKNQFFYLYASYFLVAALFQLMIYLFMRKEPPTLPSIGAEQKKIATWDSFKIIKKKKNIWMFIFAFMLVYGTVISFASNINLLLKPFEFKNVQIALMAVIQIIMGVFGSILSSLYIKRTQNYKLALKVILISSFILFIVIAIALNFSFPKITFMILAGLLGFVIIPIVPISYDIGCELCFPIGQAQAIGILNGGVMFVGFLLTVFLSFVLKSGTKTDSLIGFGVLIIFEGIGTILFLVFKLELNRLNAEREGKMIDIEKQFEDFPEQKNSKQLEQTPQRKKAQKYYTLNEDQQIQI